MDNCLRVAFAAVHMSARIEQRAQFSMVVNLTIERDPGRAVFIGHWLMAITEVHNGKTPVPKSNCVAEPRAGIIWPTVGQSVAHDEHLAPIDPLFYLYWMDNSTDPAHKFTVSNKLFLKPQPGRGRIHHAARS